MAPQLRTLALQQLGVQEHEVTLDLFATQEREARPLFVTREMDAFTFDWGRLTEGEEETLWANPPFYLLEKVVAKIWQEPCRLVLCHPNWQEAAWWQPLLTLTKVGVTLPDNQNLYFGVIKKDLLPPPEWRTCVSLVESRGDRGPYPNKKVSDWLYSRCLHRTLTHLRQEVLAPQLQKKEGPKDPGDTGDPSEETGGCDPPVERHE